MRKGVIGNCQYIALVGDEGNVDWLCWPRFDSSFVFGGLLDTGKGGYFRIAPPAGGVGQQDYIVNTNVLVTAFQTSQGKFEVIDFAPRFKEGDVVFFKPNLLMRIVRPLEGTPQVRVQVKPVYDYGQAAYAQVRLANGIDFICTTSAQGVGLRLTTNASLTYIEDATPFVIDRPYYFILSYGERFTGNPQEFCEYYLHKTIHYWQTWVKHCHVPRDYQAEVIRSALVLKLHQYEDTGAIIASATTSLPEAQGAGRNWDYRYCWLRDAWFSLAALTRLSQFEEMEKFVSYLCNLVESMEARGGRLQPVFGIGGEVDLNEKILDHLQGFRGNLPLRIGNQAFEHIQHDVYGEMILAISPLFRDRRFLSDRSCPPKGVLYQLLAKIETYMEAEDAGLWEFRTTAQLHTFTLLMHWAGAATALEIAEIQGYADLASRARKLALACEHLIHSRTWDSKLKAYTQAAGNGHLDAALLMMVNLGFLKEDNPRALGQVEAIARGLTASGGLIYRYVTPDEFGNTTNAFLVCSFWLAEAYGRLGHEEKGRALLERLLKYSNPLGLYSEDVDPKDCSLWGNFPQTYSHVGLINAAFKLSRPETTVVWP